MADESPFGESDGGSEEFVQHAHAEVSSSGGHHEAASDDNPFDGPAAASPPRDPLPEAGRRLDTTMTTPKKVLHIVNEADTPPSRPPAARSSIVQSDEFTINVVDPVRVGDGVDAFTSYTVTTQTRLPRFKKGTMSVQRRFRDFLWLQGKLREEYKGIIIPALPEKAFIGRFSKPLVEHRRRALQRFLRRIGGHAAMSQSPTFQQFLESEEELPSPKDKRQDVMQYIMKADHSINLRFHEGDRMFNDRVFSFDRDSPTLRTLCRATKAVVESRRAFAGCLTSMVNPTACLAYAASTNPLGEAMRSFSEGMRSLAGLEEEIAELDWAVFWSPLRDYVRIMKEAKGSIDRRNRAFEDHHDMEKTQQKASDKLESRRGTGDAKTLQQLETKLESASTTAEVSRQSLELMTARLEAELERFDTERLDDYQQAIAVLVDTHIQHEVQVRDVCLDMLERLQPRQPR